MSAGTLQADTPLTTEAETRDAVATQRQLIWWRFRKHKLAVVSAVIVLAFYLISAFADTIAYSAPFDTQAARSYIPPQPIHWFDANGHFRPQVYAMKGKRDLRTFKLSYAADPSDARDLTLFARGYPYRLFGLFPTDIHLFGVTNGNATDALFLFGTDQLGRDVFSRVIIGARDILTIAPLATLLGTVAGTALGLIVGYFEGWVDNVVGRAIDAVLALPLVIVALLALAAVGASNLTVILVIGITFTPITARTVRAAVFAERHLDYVAAAQLRGERAPYIMFAEILPNVLPPIIVEATVRLGYAIFAVATLSFLGFGIQPPSADWGLALSESYALMAGGAWWTVVFAAGAIASLVVGVNLIADSVQGVLDR